MASWRRWFEQQKGWICSPLQVALLWVRDAPGVTAPLLGARTAGQLAPALAIEDQTLPREIASALDDVSGGPNSARLSSVVSQISYVSRQARTSRRSPRST